MWHGGVLSVDASVNGTEDKGKEFPCKFSREEWKDMKQSNRWARDP